MKIKGSTVQLFLPLFLRSRNFNGNITNMNILTIYDILNAYVQLSMQKKTAKISVKELAAKAGYSRTTFYAYFTEVKDVHNTLEDMISYHMHINSDIYLACFIGDVTEKEEMAILNTIKDFSPYIHALMLRSPEYEQRYRNDFMLALSKVIYKADVPKETRPYLLRSISGAMVLLVNDLADDDMDSFKKSMNTAKLIIQSLIKPSGESNKK